MLFRSGFWNKLLSYDNDTVIRRVYDESRRRVEYDGNTKVWSAYTKHLLGEYGMSDDWQNNEHDPERKGRIKRTVHMVAEKDWTERMANKTTLADYRVYKPHLDCEQYLHEADSFKGRVALTCCRAGVVVCVWTQVAGNMYMWQQARKFGCQEHLEHVC